MIHHQLGNVYSKRGDSDAAMRHQQQAIAIAPEFAAAHYQLGLLYAQEKQWGDAITSYRTAYAHDATLVEALYNLAQAYLRTGDTVAAREQMARFEEQKATLAPLYQLRGALQRTRGTVERAQILANIGRLYLKNGLYEKAVWEYQKAIGLDAELVPAYNGMGIAFTMLERYPEAVVAQEKALELQPDFAKAYAGLGLVYFRQNEAELALEHYRHAVALEPEFLDAHLKIGIILLNQKRYAEAANAYKATLVLAPDNAEVYHNLGLCYAHQAEALKEGAGQLSDTRSSEDLMTAALAALEKSVELSLSNTGDSAQPSLLKETYYLIGEIQAGKADFNAAETAYLASGLPKAYHALARLSAKFANQQKEDAKRGLETARRYAQEAIHLNPNVASYYNTLALIDFRRGDYLQAEKAIRKALELDPGNPNYQQGLKQIFGKLESK
jgi:tetratricopeptide (TPR) repeat protein